MKPVAPWLPHVTRENGYCASEHPTVPSLRCWLRNGHADEYCNVGFEDWRNPNARPKETGPVMTREQAIERVLLMQKAPLMWAGTREGYVAQLAIFVEVFAPDVLNAAGNGYTFVLEGCSNRVSSAWLAERLDEPFARVTRASGAPRDLTPMNIQILVVDDPEQYVGRKAVLHEPHASLFVRIVKATPHNATVEHPDGTKQKAPWLRLSVRKTPR